MNDTDTTPSDDLDDVQLGEGVRKMVDTFYQTVRQDDLIGPIFNEKIEDWNLHLPTMYKFWERLLFGKGDYNGNPLRKHLPLPLKKEHFSRWLQLFSDNLDQNFSGPYAEEAKRLSRNIAMSFQLNMGIELENVPDEIRNYSRGRKPAS